MTMNLNKLPTIILSGAVLLSLSLGAVAQQAGKVANAFSEDIDLPPDPKPGECYMRTKFPAQYETVKQKVMVSPGTENIQIKQASFQAEPKKFLIEPERVEYKVVPAQFKKETRKVMVKPAKKELIHVPAEYKTVEEEVIVKPATQMWKRGSGVRGEVAGSEGGGDDLLCLVTVPAETKKVKRQVLVKEATVKVKEIPAVYETYEETVMVSPAKVEEKKIAAKYDTMMVEKRMTESVQKKVPVKPEFKIVERQVLVSASRMGWARVLCDTNLTKPVIMDIQDKLKAKKYDTGDKRGELSPETINAVKAYTKDNNLANGLTYDFLNHLGVKPPEAR